VNKCDVNLSHDVVMLQQQSCDIVLIAGAAKNVLCRQLESILALPGVKPKLVKVQFVSFHFGNVPHYCAKPIYTVHFYIDGIPVYTNKFTSICRVCVLLLCLYIFS